jgi:hypothetical protein
VPNLRRLWRDARRLQLGADPRHAVMIELDDPADARLLDLLDGTRTESVLVRDAARLGIAPHDALALLGELSRLGLVLDAPELDLTGLAEPARRRLSTEATAIALAGRTHPTPAHPAPAAPADEPSGPRPVDQQPPGPQPVGQQPPGRQPVGQQPPGRQPVDDEPPGDPSGLTGGRAVNAGVTSSWRWTEERQAQRRTPAVVLRRRSGAQVVVAGVSRLVVPIASALGASGVGHIDPAVTGVARLADAAPAGLLPADAHRPRGVAAAEAVRRNAPEVQVRPLRLAAASFAVLVGFSAPAALTALAHARRRTAHLAVTVRDDTVVIGPLVLPGRTPCLNCVDLHRRDRDPDWPALAAQLHTGPDTADTVAVTTMLLGAAYTAAEVIAHLDGDVPVTLGATVEIAGPGRERRRRWAAHPGCGCLTLHARHTRARRL